MSTLTNAIFKSTRHNYGARKNPEMSRITQILSRCPSLKVRHPPLKATTHTLI
jgi:hypothetical protein